MTGNHKGGGTEGEDRKKKRIEEWRIEVKFYPRIFS